MGCRRIFVIVLCFSIAAALFGCDSANHVPSESAAATEPILFDECAAAPGMKLSEAVATHNHTISYSPRKPWSVNDWVVTTVQETISWVDSVGNQNAVSVRLPHLRSGKPFAHEYNSGIDALGSRIIAEAEECAEGAFSTHIVSVDYETWLNGDTLSIVITTRTSVDYVEYRVDNFDLDDSEYMSIAEMCGEYLDLEYPQFLKLTHDMILRDFESEHSAFTAQFPEDAAFIRELFETDAFVVRNRCLYLNESGKLMLVSDRPSIAGAAYYSCIEEMTVDPALIPTETDAWHWLFDLYLGADQDNTEAARDVLILAQEEDDDGFNKALRERQQNEQEAIEAAIRVKYNSEG